MTWLVERLVELRRHLDHLEEIRPKVVDVDALRRSLSLHNDVLFSLFTVCRLVIDVAGELAARRGERFEDYLGAIRALAGDPRSSPSLISDLEPLPGLGNVIAHEYVTLDLDRVVQALDRLGPVRRFLEVVHAIEAG